MRWAAALVLAVAAGMASADEMVAVCYNYGCAGEEMALFSDERLEIVRRMLAATQTPEQERAALALVVGRLYVWAGEQTPIGADRVSIRFDAPQSAVAPGQAVVAYNGDVVIGGGWIQKAL